MSEETRAILNEQQVNAVHWGLTTHAACLIQGPPGTGKTTVIAHLVRELLEDGQKVILSAQTNTAVDTMLAALVEIGVRDFVRLGHAASSPRLSDALALAGEDPAEYFSQNIGNAALSLDELARRLSYASIVGCTTHRAVTDDVIAFLRLHTEEGGTPFDVAIVDEATQISEPMTLGPLRLARRFVLVGDHRQLPPIVSNERATTAAVEGYMWYEADDVKAIAAGGGAAPKEAPQLGLFGAGGDEEPELAHDEIRTPLSLGGLDRSLFERLVEQGIPYVMLEEQYRMNHEIQAYSSRAYYADRLLAHHSVARSRLALDADAYAKLGPRVKAVVDPEAPVVFCHVEGTDIARTNDAEADAVVETVQALLACGAGRERRGIGVVTPFRAQGQLIRKRLAEALGAEAARTVDVDTVERYQGSERDTVIVSLVKTDHAGEFLSDHRRVNVTLTRARKKLIVFGNRDCLVLSPLFRELIEQAETTRVDWQG